MLFGSSGIRRKFDRELLDIALSVGSVLGEQYPDCIVGTDTRTTSPLLARAVIAGILAAGGHARYAGIAPTPAVAYSARTADAGCMITASHNPEEYNGIKLFNRDGSSFTQSQQKDFEELLKTRHWTDWKHQGRESAYDVLTPHREAILDAVSIPPGMPVVLDCGNGAGSVQTPDLLTVAGAKPVCLTCNTTGFFGRPSEPLKEYLGYVGEMVIKSGAACAVVHDGDADRMMAFDNRGRYIDGDRLLVLFAEHLGAKKVVTTSDASMVIEEVAEVRRTPVGDAYVSEELRSWGDFGGEPSGAWIFPEISYCPDGPFAAALFCEIASGCDVAERLDAMPAYPVLRESIRDELAREIMTRLGADNPTDGIREAEDNGWYLIRASGTEPKIRITAEGKTADAARELLDAAKTRVKQAKNA